MPIAKVTCPECGASLKSAEGFEIGDEIECPKCQTEFTVSKPKASPPAPAKPAAKPKPAARPSNDDDEDEKPKKSKKKKIKKSSRGDDDGGGYSKSPIRFIVLGVLVVIMLVMGVLLYLKTKKEAGAAPELKPHVGIPA